MQVEFSKKFSRQLDKLQDKALLERLRDVVTGVIHASKLREIPNLKKLKGHSSAYRIRMGDYRLGLFINENTATFAAFEHRKDIYHKFP